jgi:hypothetical protein
MSRMPSLAFVAAVSLMSAGAHAGPSRGLSLTTAEAPPPNQIQKPATDVSQSPSATVPDATPEVKEVGPPKPTVAAKPTKKHAPAEARIIIYELHRHGIYW